MKKVSSRIVALLLVLVLMVSAAPFALADGPKDDNGGNNPPVSEPVPAETVTVTAEGSTTIQVGEEVTLTANVSSDNSTDTISWSKNSEAVSITPNGNTCKVTGVKPVPEGETITVIATAGTGEDAPHDSATITVTKRTVTINDISVDAMAVGGSVTVTPTTSPALLTGESISVSLASSNENVVKAEGAKLTAVGVGTAKVTATLTPAASEYSDFQGLTEGKLVKEFDVTVNSAALSVEASDVPYQKTRNFTAKIDGLPENASVSYTYTTGSNSNGVISVAQTSTGVFSVTGVGVGLASLTIIPDVTVNGEKVNVGSKTVFVGVYQDIDIEATAKKTSFSLSDKNALSSMYKGGSSVNSAGTTSLLAAMTGGALDAYAIRVTTSSSIGTFTPSSITPITSGITFTASKTGTLTADYEVTAYDGSEHHLVATGELTLKIGEVSGDIVYNAGSSGNVTFDENDFVKFWNNNKGDYNYTGSLSYVKFDLDGFPAYGTLYTTATGSSTVGINHQCYPNYTTSSSSTKIDLDTVTYRAKVSSTSGLTDTIPFTAYGTGTQKISGIILIEFDDVTNEITSRGVAFGTGKISDLMKDEYKTATGATLNTVVFSNVSASSGKLFYNFSNILNSTPVTTKYEFYVDPTGTQMDLDKVAFVPRAGLYGEVSIKYTGYDVNGKNSYEGKITFKVTQKTKSAVFSDVTATSYSWAADSVDFLYYEEVANGSNGKYNPKSNITRGDFMLMLYRAFLEEDYGNYNVTSNFPDVVKGTTSYSKETYQAVGVAKYLGIAQGSNGKYNPTSYITREEAMTLIYRTLDEVGYSMSYTVSTSTSSFSDYSSVSSYARAAIKDLIGHGVVIGTNGKIQPKSNITRAEMAVILHRVLTY